MKTMATFAVLTIALTLAFLPTRAGSYPQQAAGSHPSQVVLEEEIKQLEQTRQAAFVSGDIDALDRQTAEDYTTINAKGKISTKPQMMANLRSGKTKVISNSLSDLRARTFGETAVLTGALEETSETDGRRKNSTTRFTRIFVKIRGTWLALAYQATEIVPD